MFAQGAPQVAKQRPQGCRKASKLDPQIDQKSMKTRHAGTLGPSRSKFLQNDSKIRPQMVPNSTLNLKKTESGLTEIQYQKK